MFQKYRFLPSKSAVHYFSRTVANSLSLLRLLLGTGIFLSLSLTDQRGAEFSLVLLLIAATTDFLDGWVARLDKRSDDFKTTKWFGPWIDAFTDFFLFLCVYGSLYRLTALPAWLFSSFLLRESAMYLIIRPTAVRLGVDHSARLPGKIKTVLQYSATSCLIALLIVAPKISLTLDSIRVITTIVVTGLTVVSFASLYWYLKPIFSNWPIHQKGLPQRLCIMTISLLSCQILAYNFLVPVSIFWDFFLLGTTLFHTVLAGFLFSRHKDFLSLNPSRYPKNIIGIPNILTLFRLSSIPTLTLILGQNLSGDIPLLILVAIVAIFITDLLDGAIARYTKKITRIGSYLDSATDYVALSSLAILMLIHQLVPIWLFMAIILRLGSNSVLTTIIILLRGIHKAKPTLWGKISILSIAILVILELIAHSGHTYLASIKPIIPAAEILTFLLICVSLVDKTSYFFRTLKENR